MNIQTLLTSLQLREDKDWELSKLLVDVDSTIGKGMNSIFGSYATTNLTYNSRADYWMAAFVYRLFSDAINPGSVKGITVWLFDESKRIDEPYLSVGELEYELAPEQTYGLCPASRFSRGAQWHMTCSCSAWDPCIRQIRENVAFSSKIDNLNTKIGKNPNLTKLEKLTFVVFVASELGSRLTFVILCCIVGRWMPTYTNGTRSVPCG